MNEKSKGGRRNNALKHGAFAKAPILEGENPSAFRELLQGCIADLQPRGRLENEVVREIAELIWRKQRVNRLFLMQSNYLENEKIEMLRKIAQVEGVIKNGFAGLPSIPRFQQVWVACEAYLPKDFLKILNNDFGSALEGERDVTLGLPGRGENAEQWVTTIEQRLNDLRPFVEDRFSRESPQFLNKLATHQMDVTTRQIELEDRLNAGLDRAFKRLAILKTFKEIAAPKAIATYERKNIQNN